MKLFIVGLVVLGLMTTPITYANDRDEVIERQMEADPQFAQKRQQAITQLKERGYQVTKVEPDVHLGQKALEIEAFKNGQEYDILMDYSSLKIIKEEIDK